MNFSSGAGPHPLTTQDVVRALRHHLDGKTVRVLGKDGGLDHVLTLSGIGAISASVHRAGEDVPAAE